MPNQIVLVSMPWLSPNSPSMALGTIHALLEEGGLTASTKSFHISAVEFFSKLPVWKDYIEAAESEAQRKDEISKHISMIFSDLIWSKPETLSPIFSLKQDIGSAIDGKVELDKSHYVLAGSDKINTEQRLIDLIQELRKQAPLFLKECLEEIKKCRPKVVGFSLTFTIAQITSVLALSKMLKAELPDVEIIIGGSLSGSVGPAMLRGFPWIDVAVRGRVEDFIVPLMKDLLEDREPIQYPGICYRKNGEIVIHEEQSGNLTPMDKLPIANYDEFFNLINKSSLKPYFNRLLRIPFESSKGCWWGQKHQCRFCGLNMNDINYSQKSPDRVFDEILGLSKKYKCTRFVATDCIISQDYFNTLLPKLEKSEYNFKLTYEVKSNLNEDQVKQLARAGVYGVQPGIESLSSPVLRIMNKGVTALQNIRLLKWLLQYDITPYWNFLYGFPSEPQEEYTRMAKLIPSLWHLPAPGHYGPMVVVRHSPYFQQPEKYGIRILAPSNRLNHLLDVDADVIKDLSFDFIVAHEDNRDPAGYIKPLLEAIKEWQKNNPKNLGMLTYVFGPDFMIIDDLRAGRNAKFHLDASEARIYLECNGGSSPIEIANRLNQKYNINEKAEDIQAFLKSLETEGLVYSEDDRFLGLAIPNDARGQRS